MLLKIADVLTRLNIKRTSLHKLRHSDPTFPRPLYLSDSERSIRFRSEDIDEWLARRERLSRAA